MSAETEAVTRQWLHYAEGDLLSAKVLAASNDLPPRNACYLAQQCAEKALKAVLITVNIEPLRTHDLDALVQRMPEEQKESFVDFDPSWLSEWCVEARYPSASTTLQKQEISRDALHILAVTFSIFLYAGCLFIKNLYVVNNTHHYYHPNIQPNPRCYCRSQKYQ